MSKQKLLDAGSAYGFTYNAYTGGAGPSPAQAIGNEIVLLDWLSERIEKDPDNCDAQVSFIMLAEPNAEIEKHCVELKWLGRTFDIVYDRWGFVFDVFGGRKLTAVPYVDQCSLVGIKAWFEAALEAGKKDEKRWWMAAEKLKGFRD